MVDFPTDAPDSEIATAFIRHIDAKTRFVSYSETSNVNGFRIPDTVRAEMWNHVRNRVPRCHVHVDGTMSWGARALDLPRHHCHSFVSSAHKWFLGPKETAILCMSADNPHQLQPAILAYDYKITIDKWDKMLRERPSALRFELLGQRDDVNLITLHATQLMWTRLAARRQPFDRVVELAMQLKQALRDSRWTLETPLESNRSCGIVRIKAPKRDGDAHRSLFDWIYSEVSPYRVAGSGSSGNFEPEKQTFRLCPHVYNTRQDINNVVVAMNTWRDLHGLRP